MARASVPTLLPLDTFAKILGINPVHFNGASAPPVWDEVGDCRSVWTQYAWQSEDVTSREEVAQAIFEAEKEIGRILGYPVAPTWFKDEEQVIRETKYNKTFNPNTSFKLKHGKIIGGGRRNSTLIDDEASIVYSDQDGDGFKETATIVVAVDSSITDPNQVRVYFNDHQSNPAWEIRPARSRVISGGNATLVFDSWLFIIPDYTESPPGQYEYQPINISLEDNLVESVTVYRVWNDNTQASSTIYRSGGYCASCNGNGCYACANYTQDGCLMITDSDMGMVVSSPATYNADIPGWQRSTYQSQLPLSVHFWYYAGAIGDEYIDGYSDIPMPFYIQQSVTYLAAARLYKPFCMCGNVEKTLQELRRDLGQTTDEGNPNRTPFDSVVFSNPFGTRVGEVRAWHRINSLIRDQVWEAAIL